MERETEWGFLVPTISQFYGIVIQMQHREHGPAHFHAAYGEFESLVGIDPVTILTGNLPPRQRRLVLQWATLHQTELVDNWHHAMSRESLVRIEPLP